MKIYNNIKVLDFHSLYPSIICQLNLSPEFQYTDNHHNDLNQNLIINKNEFNYNHNGVLPKYVKELMSLREDYKSKGMEAEQLAVKIIQNSVYGILSQRNAKFVLGSTSIASTITWFGRTILSNLIKELEKYNIIVVYGKTDSIFVYDELNRTGKEVLSICQTTTNDLVKKYSGRDNEYIIFDLEDELEKVLLVNKNNYIKVHDENHKTFKGASFFNKTYSQFQTDLVHYLVNEIIMGCELSTEYITKIGHQFLKSKRETESLGYFSVKHKLRDRQINKYDNISYLLDNDLSVEYGFYYNVIETVNGVILYPVGYVLDDDDFILSREWLEGQVNQIVNKLEVGSKFKQVTLM